MKVTLESTNKIVKLVIDGKEVPGRIWEGRTEGGIPCHAFITRIAVHRQDDADEFERDLQEQREPTFDVQGIPLRLIL